MKTITITFTDDTVIQFLGDPMFDPSDRLLIVQQGDTNIYFNWDHICFYVVGPESSDDDD